MINGLPLYRKVSDDFKAFQNNFTYFLSSLVLFLQKVLFFLNVLFETIYQTLEKGFHYDIHHDSFSVSLLGVGYFNVTLFLLVDIYTRLKKNVVMPKTTNH